MAALAFEVRTLVSFLFRSFQDFSVRFLDFLVSFLPRSFHDRRSEPRNRKLPSHGLLTGADAAKVFSTASPLLNYMRALWWV